MVVSEQTDFMKQYHSSCKSFITGCSAQRHIMACLLFGNCCSYEQPGTVISQGPGRIRVAYMDHGSIRNPWSIHHLIQGNGKCGHPEWPYRYHTTPLQADRSVSHNTGGWFWISRTQQDIFLVHNLTDRYCVCLQLCRLPRHFCSIGGTVEYGIWPASPQFTPSIINLNNTADEAFWY
jgi:hypothetical protein